MKDERNIAIKKMADEEHPHWEIAKIFGISRQRVDQIIAEMKEKEEKER